MVLLCDGETILATDHTALASIIPLTTSPAAFRCSTNSADFLSPLITVNCTLDPPLASLHLATRSLSHVILLLTFRQRLARQPTHPPYEADTAPFLAAQIP